MICLHINNCIRCRQHKKRWHRTGDVSAKGKEMCMSSPCAAISYRIINGSYFCFVLISFWCMQAFAWGRSKKSIFAVSSLLPYKVIGSTSRKEPRVIKFLTRSHMEMVLNPQLFSEFKRTKGSTDSSPLASHAWDGGKISKVKYHTSGTAHISFFTQVTGIFWLFLPW